MGCHALYLVFVANWAREFAGVRFKLTKSDLEAEERPAGVSRYIGSRDGWKYRQVLLDVDGFLRLLEGASKVEAYYLVDFGMVVGWCWWRDGPGVP
jgi:hypothetical protein